MKIHDLATHAKPYVTVAELVEYTEIPRRTMYHQIEKGTLKAVKMGGTLKIPIEEARRYVSQPAQPTEQQAQEKILCAIGAIGTQSSTSTH